MIKLVFVDFR